jgi:Glu-tRNA(Gln) amidotransferase subunit E-like FAD-binding protein
MLRPMFAFGIDIPLGTVMYISESSDLYKYAVTTCHTRFLRPKPDAHRMYAQDQVVIHTVRM